MPHNVPTQRPACQKSFQLPHVSDVTDQQEHRASSVHSYKYARWKKSDDDDVAAHATRWSCDNNTAAFMYEFFLP